jgi:non-ribosomal peptide synthetase component F
MAPQTPQRSSPPGKAGGRLDRTRTRVLAVVKDLFFVARIRETARLAGVPLAFARTVDDLEAALAEGARLVLVDLTGGFDYERVFAAVEALEPAQRPHVLAFTTHALARTTQPWHSRCARVVTKETLTQELPALLREGVAP